MSVENAGAEPVQNTAPETNAPAPETNSVAEVKAHDDMGDTVRELYRRMGKPGNEGREPVHRPAAEPVKAPERGTDGKFKAAAAKETPAQEQKEPEKKPEAAAPENATPADDPAAEGAVAEEAAEEKPAEPAKPVSEADKAPTSWKAGAQAKFAALDPEVKAEIHRREADFHKGLGEYKQLANIGKLLHAEIEPYAAMLREAKVTPQNLIKDLMQTASVLRGGTQAQKIQLIREVANQYNIDLNAVVPTEEEAAAMAARPQHDPEVPALREALAKTQDQIKQLTEAQQAGLKAEIDAFKGAPGHENFDEVSADMAALLESGRAKTLQEAYDNACYANPTVRAKLLAQQQEAQRKRAADKAAAAKKAAATNVQTRGSLPSQPVWKGTDKDATIRNTLKASKARQGAS